MRPSAVWPKIIRELCDEQSRSERALCKQAEINRNTFRQFLAGKTSLKIDQFERVLAVLGYYLDAIRVPDEEAF
jgi:transcriptional regulator with XRE-family HTH domain